MSYLPRAISIFFEGPAAAEIIKAIQSYTETIEWKAGQETIESVDRLNRALGLLESMARFDGASFAAAGGIPMLLKLCNLLAPSNPQAATMPASLRPLAASIVLSSTNTLDGLSRSAGGLEALLNKEALNSILNLALSELPSTEKYPHINGHLSPCFRVLDRVARNEVGRELLLGLDATATILKVLSVVSAMKNKALEELVMRVLGRLMGSSVEILINRIEGYYFVDGERLTAEVSNIERDLAVRLLANIMSDGENRATMLANEAAFAKRLIVVMQSAFAKASTAADSFISILASLARHNADAIVSLFYLHSLSTCASLLLQFPGTANVLETSASFYDAMLDCNTMATLLANPEVGTGGVSPLTAVLRSLSVVAGSAAAGAPAACVATLAFLEKLIAFGLSSTELAKDDALVHAVKAMKTHPSHIVLQTAATDFLNAATDREEHVRLLMKEGVTGPLLRNLRSGSSESTASNSASGSGAANDKKSGAANAEDNDADNLFEAAANANVSGNTSHLIASTMYLITTLCIMEENVTKLKAEGVLKAVLAGFRGSSNDSKVYRNFREVIMTLQIEDKDVTCAITSVSIATSQLQHILTQADPDSMRATARYVSFITGHGITFPGGADARNTLAAALNSTPSALTDTILENIALLEATTVSPKYVSIMSRDGGLHTLLRTLGVISSANSSGGDTGKAKVSAMDAPAAVTTTRKEVIPTPVVDEILSRACNTLTHMQRVVFEFEGNAEISDATFDEKDIANVDKLAENVRLQESLDMITHALLQSAKPSLPTIGRDGTTLLSWLASSQSSNLLRSKIDTLISAQGIEACVAILRAHQERLEISSAVATALSRIAISERGASAVVQRGGSRQIIRMLRETAALRSKAGDSLFLAFLRLLDTCASAGGETVDILRRQNLVDILVDCVDAGTDLDFVGENIPGPMTIGDRSIDVKERAKISSKMSKQRDPAVQHDIEVTTSSLLSKLVNVEQMNDTIDVVNGFARDLASQTIGYNPSRSIAVPDYQRGCVHRPIVRLGLLFNTTAAGNLPDSVLVSALESCMSLANSSLSVMAGFRLLNEQDPEVVEGTALPHEPHPDSVEAELVASLPAAIRTVRLLVEHLAKLKVAGKHDVVKCALPTLLAHVDTLMAVISEFEEDRVEGIAAFEALYALAQAAKLDPAIGQAMAEYGNGKSVSLLMHMLRAAVDGGDEAGMASALNALSAIAGTETGRALCVKAGVQEYVMTLLSDSINDISAETTAAAMNLLSQLGRDPSALSALLNTGSGAFELMRVAVSRHCSDPYHPNPDVLASVTALADTLSTASDVVQNVRGKGDDFRNALRRIIKAASGSVGYVENACCMKAVLQLMSKASTPSDLVPSDVAELNKVAILDAGAEELITLAMSASSATDVILLAGQRALQSLGAASRGAKTLEEIDAYACRIPEWIDAGWKSNSPEVLNLITEMSDKMRSFGTHMVIPGQIASAISDGSIVTNPGVLNSISLEQLPDLGENYHAVLMTLWRAVDAVTGDRMTDSFDHSSAHNTGAAGKTLPEARADVLALGAQLAGRLASFGMIGKLKGDESGRYIIQPVDAVSVLATVAYTATHQVTSPRVIEALCRTAENLLDLSGQEGISAMHSTGVTSSLSELLKKLQLEKQRGLTLAATGNIDGAGADLLMSMDELQRCEDMVTACIKNLLGKSRAILVSTKKATPGSAQLHGSTSALVELLTTSAELLTEDLILNGEAMTHAEMYQLAESVANTLTSPDPLMADVSFKVLRELGDRFHAELEGSLRLVRYGKCDPKTVAANSSTMFTINALTRAIASKIEFAGANGSDASKTLLKGTASRLESVVATLRGVIEAGHNAGKKWENVAKQALAGQKSSKQDNELTPLPDDFPYTQEELDIDESAALACTQTWNETANCANKTLAPMLSIISMMDYVRDGPDAVSLQNLEKLTAPIAYSLQNAGEHPHITASKALQVLCRNTESSIPIFNYTSDEETGAVLCELTANIPKPAPSSIRQQNIKALGEQGVFKATALSMTNPVHAEDEVYCSAVCNLLHETLTAIGGDVVALGLDKQCLQALQALVRKFPNVTSIATAASSVIDPLEAIFTEQSGTAFETMNRRALDGLQTLAVNAYTRHMDPEGKMYYKSQKDGSSTYTSPDSMNVAMRSLCDVDRMSRVLEDEAVTVVDSAVITGLVSTLKTHAHDPGIVGIVVASLAKLAANPDNFPALRDMHTLQIAVEAIHQHNHETDPRISESFACLVLPFSFDPFHVREILGPSNVAQLLIAIAKRFKNHLTKFTGSRMAWPPANIPDYNEQIEAIQATDSPDSEEKNSLLPRLVQWCAQSIANMACENEPHPDTGMSMVDILVENDAISILADLVSTHTDNPRLLEDSICGLSNLAFVSDTIQQLIGRTCMLPVCAASTRFNGDPDLFQMTLRAIGNLTRIDENILRAVGFRVIRGMVEGIHKHIKSPDVLKLCADVIGNMASIDPKKFPVDEAVKVLRETISVSNDPDNSHMLAVAEQLQSGKIDAKEAVCSLLHKDGGAQGLIDTMLKHPTCTDLASSCLRALHYIASSADITQALVTELDLAKHVVYIMSCNDTSADVLRRGVRILGSMAGIDKLANAIVEARAAPILISAIDSHRDKRDVTFLCYSVLTLLRTSAVATSMKELKATDPTIQMFKQALANDDAEYYAVLLELLLGLSLDPDLAVQISPANKAGTALIELFQKLVAEKTPIGSNTEKLTLLSYTLSCLTALVRTSPVAASTLFSVGLLPVLTAAVEQILEAGKEAPALLLSRDSRRTVVMSVTIMAESIRPPASNATLSKEGQDGMEGIHPENALAVISNGCGALLEQVLAVYQAIPDEKNPGTVLFDAATCKTVTAALMDLEKVGYKCAVPLNPEFLVTDDAPALPTTTPGEQAEGDNNSKHLPSQNLIPLEVNDLIMNPRKGYSWIEGKGYKAQFTISPDMSKVIVSYFEKKGVTLPTLEIAFPSIHGIAYGNPPNMKKKKFFGKNASDDNSIHFEGENGVLLLHFEVEDEDDREVIATASAALSRAE